MVDIYLLTLALSIGIGFASTVALLALSRTERFLGLFNIRGPQERPRWGGVVLLTAFALTPFVASGISSEASDLFSPREGHFLGFLAAVSLVFLVGFLDDLRLTSPQLRLAVTAVAGTAVYAAGYRLDDVGLPGGLSIHSGYASIFVTLIWIWLTTNAFNFIDGRDGVSMGVAIFAAITMAVVGGHSHHPTVALLLVALAGGGLGFLPFNLPPASTFIGDSGAYVVGFVIGVLSLRAATGPTDQVFIAVPIVALGFPILDLVLAATRRMLHGKHPMRGDEDHIHHRIELYGAGPRGILMITYSLAALCSLGAILLHYVDETWMEAVVFIGLAAAVGGILLKLGYVLTIWNSHSIVWLRQRVFAPEVTADRGD
jgi:UDP-GlcNAc:undecaprenyl-phosphate GlcNAc-1-phosphate transferase